jgi:hypothetical protein
MTPAALNLAIEEAERFLAKAKALRDAWDVAIRDKNATDSHLRWLTERLPDSRPAAAVRRASLDLTMALAALRKGG